MTVACFADERYERLVGDDRLTLVPFPASKAEAFGAAIAAMHPWATYGYPAAAIASYLAGDERAGVRFLVQLTGVDAGVIGLQPDWLRGPYLRFLVILPPFQGRGIGSELLRWLEAEAHAAGERNLWVIASQINTEARGFYERHGFACAAEFDDLAYDARTEILLRKRLTATT